MSRKRRSAFRVKGFRRLYPWQAVMSCVHCSVASVLGRFWSWSKTHTGRQETVEAHCSMLGETTPGPETALVDQCLTDGEAAVVSLQHFLARRLVSFAYRRVWIVFFFSLSDDPSKPLLPVHLSIHGFALSARPSKTLTLDHD